MSKAADRNTALCVWEQKMDRLRGTFGRQALPMVWTYVETNPFSVPAGDIYGTVRSVCEVLDNFIRGTIGAAAQTDATQQTLSLNRVVSTITVLRQHRLRRSLRLLLCLAARSLKLLFPELFATLAAPKAEELVATPYRHGSRNEAEVSFWVA